MNSQQILSLYKNAIRITKSTAQSRKLFHTWSNQPINKRLMIYDTETTGLVFDEPTILHHDDKDISCPGPVVFGISLCLPIGKKLVLVWTRMDTKLYDDVIKLLNVASTKAAHMARYDIRMMQIENIKVAGVTDCTYTMARIIYDRRRKHSLQSLTETWCPELSDWEDAVHRELTRLKTASTRAGNPKDYINYSFIDDKLMCPYSMTDSFMTYIGYRILWPQIEETFAELYERERKVYYKIIDVEKRGITFNAVKGERYAKKMVAAMDENRETMRELVADDDFNPNAPAQVVKAIKFLGVKERDLMLKGKVTSDANVLKRVAENTDKKRAKKFIDELLNYRSLIKVTNTYLLPLSKRSRHNDGIVYTSINPADSRTGRMASRSPNLQNIPEPTVRRSGKTNQVRECFEPRKGCVIYYPDYSQMEMAVFGLYAGEEKILEPYARGEDIHGYMATYRYGKDYTEMERNIMKNNNFGVIYGLGVRTMALQYGISETEATTQRNQYYKDFPSIREFQGKCRDELEYQGYVEDYFGKRYHVPSVEAYKAVNCLVQGGCAQAFKIGFLQVDAILQHGIADIILPVHDEIQIETIKFSIKQEKDFCNNVIEQMVAIPQLTDRGLLLRVDVKKTTTNWAEKVEVKL